MTLFARGKNPNNFMTFFIYTREWWVGVRWLCCCIEGAVGEGRRGCCIEPLGVGGGNPGVPGWCRPGALVPYSLVEFHHR